MSVTGASKAWKSVQLFYLALLEPVRRLYLHGPGNPLRRRGQHQQRQALSQHARRRSFTAWTTFDIADRFQLGGGAIYNSKQYGSFGTVANVGTIVRSVPSYWRFDATAAVDVTDNAELRVNAQNLTNKRYYDRTYTTHFVSIAPGRSVFGTDS